MLEPLDLVYYLDGESYQAYATTLTDLGGPYRERWLIVPRDAGFDWSIRRRRTDVESITCLARGHKELAHWPLTTYRGRAPGLIAVEPRAEAKTVLIVLREALLDTLRSTRWGNTHIHLYAWRLTFMGRRWRVEARRVDQPDWQELARSMPVGRSEPNEGADPGRPVA